MKKTIFCMLTCLSLIFMVACENNQNPDPTHRTTPSDPVFSTSASTEETIPTPLTGTLSVSDYFDRLRNYATQEGFLGVTDLTQSEVSSKAGAVTYSCDYDEGLVSLNISAQDEQVAFVYSAVSPYTIIDIGASTSMSDAQQIAYSLALEPIIGINENWDHSWHLQQFLDAADEGSSSTIQRTYTKDNWSFTVIFGEALVSVSALNNNLS